MSDWDTPGGTDWDTPGAGGAANAPSNGALNDDFGSGPSANNGIDSGPSGGGGGGGACRVCNEEGHFARECPQKPAGSSGCFNCGQEGHSKADCPNPRVFKGTCRVCEKEGHPAAECPDKPADLCKNCKKEGHKVVDCKEARSINRDHIKTLEPGEAWAAVLAADKSRDMDDVRETLQVYVKSVPESTWAQLESSFRTNHCNTHLIAYKKDITDTFTLMDLQGNLDREYHVGFYWSEKPQRGLMKEAWPPSPEDNVLRLSNAGIPVDRGIPKCNNCEKLGHISKHCPEERVERTDIVGVKCVNCDEEGHRARDCPQPRKDRFACRNCGGSDHKAADCTEPRSAVGVECKHCGEMGHFVKDCPKREPQTCRNCGEEGHRSKECENPPNPELMVCRNCDAKGHMSKECPKPRDYSRVTCQNCGEKGHTKVRCKKPVADDGAGGGFDTAGGGGFDSTSGGFDAGYGGGGDDFSAPAVAVTASGSGGDDGW